MIEQHRLIPASDLERFLVWMEHVLIDEVGPKKAFKVVDKLKSFKLEKHEIG